MSKKRNYYSASKKSKIAIAAIEGKLTQAQLTSEHGVYPTQIKMWKQTALQAISEAFSSARDKDKKAQAELIVALYEEIGRLQAQLSWLKKSLSLSLDEKRKLIDNSAEITIREQCMLLGLNVSSYYSCYAQELAV